MGKIFLYYGKVHQDKQFITACVQMKHPGAFKTDFIYHQTDERRGNAGAGVSFCAGRTLLPAERRWKRNRVPNL